MNKHLRTWLLVLTAAFALGLTGCASKKVERVSSDTAKDLSGNWNDVDSQEVSKALILDALEVPWHSDFKEEKGRKPVVVAYGVKNRTAEHINTQTFMKDLERAFLRSGKVKVVANQEERQETRSERADQNTGFSANPASFGKETGADFVITGVLNAINDKADGEEVVFYQANMELINVETNEKVWIGEHKIKKFLARARTSF